MTSRRVDVADRHLKQRLIAAVRSNDVIAVRQCIQAGVDPNTICDAPLKGSSILSLASRRGFSQLVSFLASSGANMEHIDTEYEKTPFLEASTGGYVPIISLLAELNCNTEARNKTNNGALALASLNGRLNAVKFLVDVVRLSVKDKHQCEQTPLHMAAQKGHTHVCEFLLQREAEIESLDMIDGTPFLYAAYRGHVNVLKLLHQWKCNTSAKNKNLETALHLACRENHVACAEFLISNGADSNIKDKYNYLPHQLAKGNLRNTVKFARLYAGGTVSVECVKICLIGDERAGKTTLAKAIKRTWLQYLFSSDEKAPDTFNISERTAEHCHRTHDMFFDKSNSLYIMVLSGLLSRSQMFDQCRHWAAFLTAALHQGAIPVVIIVISRRDACSDLAKVEAISQGVVIELKGMFKSVLNIQERFFILDCRKSHATEMVQFREFLGELKRDKLKTVRKYPSLVQPVIKKLLPHLRKGSTTKLMEKCHLTSLVRTELTVPQVVDHTVEETVDFLHASGEAFLINDLALIDIPWMSHSLLGPVMAPPEFPEHLEAAESRRKEGTATKEEISTVIQNFQRRQGKCPEHINTDYATKALETLEVIFELEDRPGVYCIPSHLRHKDRREVWQKLSDPQMCYVGRRVACVRDIDIFTLAFFVFFQSRLAVAIDRKAVLYKGGAKVSRVVKPSIFVECLVEQTKHHRAVDLIARANKNGQRHALKFLQEVNDILVQVLKEKSPGTLTRRFLLHIPHLTEGRLEAFGFPEEDIIAAKTEGKEIVNGVEGDQYIIGNLRDLMAATDLQDTKSLNCEEELRSVDREGFQQPASMDMSASPSGLKQQALRNDPFQREACATIFGVDNTGAEEESASQPPINDTADLEPVLDAVLKCAPHEWYSIALKLDFSDGQIVEETSGIATGSGKLEKMVRVKAAALGRQVTARLLLEACEKMPNPVIGAVRERLHHLCQH